MLDFFILAKTCVPNVDPITMASIIKHESNLNPYAIHINDGKLQLKRQPTNQMEAITLTNFLKEKNINFDAGLGQVNVKNLKWVNIFQ